jgi:predicted nucleic acid-binding protein
VILVDTSIWIDHLHSSDPHLVEQLDDVRVATHAMVLGEMSLGSIANRRAVLRLMEGLPSVVEATHVEVMALVESHSLFGRGLSLLDAHLLASVHLSPGTSLWTRDKRLRQVAREQNIEHDIDS